MKNNLGTNTDKNTTAEMDKNIYPSVATNKILRLPDVIARVGLKRASIYQHVSMGTFPKPVSLGIRAVGWLEHEIDGWLSERIQMRGRNKQHKGENRTLE